MKIDQTQIEKAVIAQTVAKLVDDFGAPDGEIAQAVQRKAEALIGARVNEAVESHVKRVVEEGLEGLIFPATNVFGESKKPDRTLREFIAERTDAVFNETLDSNGLPTNEAWYTKDPANRRIVRLIKDAVGKHIEKEVIAAANAAKSQINSKICEVIKIQLDELTMKLKA